MKKIGIITLNGKHNYGNRLQNYALQKAVTGLSAHATTLTEPSKFSPLKSTKSVLKFTLQHSPLYKNRFQYIMKRVKSKGFRAFDDTYIEERALDNDAYDLYLSGSDQVWNPRFAGKDFHFLTFAPSEKRFSYAASFGVSEIPEEQRDRYAKHLKNFNKISVREDDGKKLVEELTGRDDIIVVPDPTMLLTRDDWNKLASDAKPADAPSGRFIVIYALHALSADNQSKVQAYADEKGYEIYQIMGDIYNKSHKIPDPREFVWLVANAQAVFTDSFHCCVFSIIYHTPFIVFDRTDGQKMSSRLTTLTQKFNLTQAMTDGSTDFDAIFASEDFSETDKTLSDYREVGMKFLSEILHDVPDDKIER